MDPIFKGCMRPALLFGVPMLPFVLVAMPMIILILLVSFWFMLVFAVLHQLMVSKTKQDELYFELVTVRLKTFFMVRSCRTNSNKQRVLLASTTAARTVEVLNE